MPKQQGFVSVGVLIAILVVLVVLGGSSYYVVQQQAPTQTATENFDNVQQQSTPLTREDVKIGDKVGGFVVTDIKVIALPSGDRGKDFRINFSGETVVTGTYAVGGFSGPEEVSINVSKTDNPQLPYFLLDSAAREVTISFSNPITARQALTANSGKVSVKIKNLSAAWATGTEAVTTAEFVVLAQANEPQPS